MNTNHETNSSTCSETKLSSWIVKVEHIHRILILLLFIAIMLVATVSVIARNADLPLMWTEELSRALFIWLTCLGAALAVRQNSHLSLKLLDHFFSSKMMNLMKFIVQIISSAILLALVKPVIVLIQTGAGTSTTMLNIPWSLLYLPFGISVLLMIIYHANIVFQMGNNYRSGA